MSFRHRIRRHLRRRHLPVLGVLMAVVTAACGGPRAPLDIGAKPVPLDLVLGAKRAVAGALVPPAAVSLDSRGAPIFGFDQVALPSSDPLRRRRQAPPAPTGCIDDLLAVPKDVALPFQLGAPRPNSYTYRVTGSVKSGDTTEPLPETAKVEVLNSNFDVLTVQASWQVAVTLGDATTTTSYRARIAGLAESSVSSVKEGQDGLGDNLHGTALEGTSTEGLVIQEAEFAAPERPDESQYWPEGDPFTSLAFLKGRAPSVPPYPAEGKVDDTAQPPRGLHHGVYIEKIDVDGRAFVPPAPGMLLARYPMQVGSTFDVAATDGLTTMAYRTTVKPKATVHACGTAIDTWTVQLTRGRIIDVRSGEEVNFTARYQLATQYGGLIVSDSTEVKGQQSKVPSLVPIERTIATNATTAPR